MATANGALQLPAGDNSIIRQGSHALWGGIVVYEFTNEKWAELGGKP